MAGDNPINNRTEDKLDRGPFVDALAQTIRTIDPSQGAVLGLLGSWGLGKSSVLNMLKETLQQEPPLVTIAFEPWLFTGTSELVSLFFAHMSAELGTNATDRTGRKLARLFGQYGQTLAILKWVPLAGSWLDRLGDIAGIVAKVQQKRHDKAAELSQQRKELTRLLRDRETPIVVIIDEIDRLLPHEVRDIFTLVRLTAKFPKLIYVLAFDRGKVESMLDEPGFGGRGYLEKIVELPLDLPAVSRRALDTILTDTLGELRNRIPAGPFHPEQWEQVYPNVLRPLFKDLRDVNRFLLALPAALATVGREVAFVDTVTLEALRLLQPEAYAELTNQADLLTTVTREPGTRTGTQAQLNTIIDAVPEEQPETRKAVRALCYLLFPATQRYQGGVHYGTKEARQWRAHHRVASRTVLDIYLGRVLGPQVAPADLMDQVRVCLSDAPNLRSIFDTLPDNQLEDVLIRLEGTEPDAGAVSTEPAIAVLADLYPRLAVMAAPSTTTGLWISPERSNDRAIAHLLGCVPDEKSRLEAVQRVLSSLPSLYSRMRLLYATTSRSPARPALIAEPDADHLRHDLWRLVRHSTVAQLASEPRLLTLLLRALHDDPLDRDTISEHLSEPDVMAALLRDPGTTTAITSFSGHPLATLFGGRGELGVHIERFATRADPAVLQDPQISRALAQLRTHLKSDPPLPEWARRQVEFTSTTCAPRNLSEPRDEAAHLVLRAAALYQVSSQRSQSIWLNTGPFRDAFAGFLRDGDAVQAVADYCAGHDLPTATLDSAPETSEMAPRYVVLRRTLTGPGSRVVLTARVGISLPAHTDALVRVFTELCVGTPNTGKEPTSPPLSLIEVRNLLTALLTTTNAIAVEYLPTYLAEPALPHDATEIHIACPSRNVDGVQRQANIGDVIDLAPLGERTEATSPRDGEYRATADFPIDLAADRGDLVNHAILSMAGPFWAYLHADQPLAELLQPESLAVLERW